MTGEIIRESVFESERFRAMLAQLTLDAVTADLTAVTPIVGQHEIDWTFALFCASALSCVDEKEAQAATLRIAHSCLTAEDVDPAIRTAAAVILERLGNRQSINLATRRGLVAADSWTEVPAPLQEDVIRRRLELTISTAAGAIAASTFQREFWSAASASRWLSVSAPTSAGKSFIVKRWIEEQAAKAETFRGVYVVPTRALIEEVSLDLIADFGPRVRVHTMPWDSEIGVKLKEVFVVTQERLHLLQQRLPNFAPELLFIDEAQKFDDDARGVLLQQVLDEALRRAPEAQVIFASPFAANPGVLLEGAPEGARALPLDSQSVTVNQNLLYANQVPHRPLEWTLALATGAVPEQCGTFRLVARPAPASKRLPFVAVTLGGDRPGNVVYVNGAADAEKAAKQIYEALGSSADMGNDEDINNLRELATSAVHPLYSLQEVLQRGVAFHYGNMPLLIKTEIERLFKSEKLRYLVCTSTLLEGVNLPCRNLFVRGPRKGRSHVMSPADFWNLAGRAGRWGKEFQGNVVCVDTTDQRQWPTLPGVRTRQSIRRASARVLDDIGALTSYIAEGTPVDESRAEPVLESVFSMLAACVVGERSVAEITGIALPIEQAEALQTQIREALGGISFPAELVTRHAGISPLSMQRLYGSFGDHEDPADLVIPPPESRDAAEAYVRAITRVHRELGGDWGPSGRRFQLAILVTQWMQGIPLSRLIATRLTYEQRRSPSANAANVIRSVMGDVEQIARFQAPRYLSCYQDLLRHYAIENELDIVDDMTFDINMLLELGVSRTTEVSLMAIGLSRTTTIAISELIVEDEMSPQQVLDWLAAQQVEALPIAALAKREIAKRLQVEGTSM